MAVSDVFVAWSSGDFDAFARALAPDVELVGCDPGSGDCRNRQEDLTLLRQRHEQGRTTGVIRIDDIGGALVVSGVHCRESARPVEAASATLVIFRDGKIIRLRQYRTRVEALAAAGARA
ncbi:nuclear transport factor 2 family protein [Streptomyces sp. NPDC000880]